MKKLNIIILTLLFLSQCSQKVFVDFDPAYDTEVKKVTGETYPAMKSAELIEKITVEEKTFNIQDKEGRDVVKIPRKLLSDDRLFSSESGWVFHYDKSAKTLFASPVTYPAAVNFMRQDPDDPDQPMSLKPGDLDFVNVLFAHSELDNTRYLPEDNRPDKIELKVPQMSGISMDDYLLKVDLPGYEPLEKSITRVVDQRIILKLVQSELKLLFKNLDDLNFKPAVVSITNIKGTVKEISAQELIKGKMLYEAEFPVTLKLNDKIWQLYQDDEPVIGIALDKPGRYEISFKEKEREFPVVFFDQAEGPIELEAFDKWLQEKLVKSDRAFVYGTNGYETVMNQSTAGLKKAVDNLFRMEPRTSNILESLETFGKTCTETEYVTEYVQGVEYGRKVSPKFYFFLSDENSGRLEYSLDRLEILLNETGIPKSKVTIFMPVQIYNNRFEKYQKRGFAVEAL